MMPIKVFLVDDHKLLRDTLRMFLESFEEIIVIGESGTCKDAVMQILELKPEVVLMDITLPDSDGVEATVQIMEKLPLTKVIAVTMHPEELYLIKFLEAGGVGYVHKTAADREILQAIKQVREGKVFLSPEGVQVMAEKYIPQNVITANVDTLVKESKVEISPEILSDRERQVLMLLSRGYNCREIGESLFLSTSTVETYKRRLSDKLQLKNTRELIEYSIHHKIFEEF